VVDLDGAQQTPARRRPGRPISTQLSDQLLTAALRILAKDGWEGLNADRIAASAKAGKAGIYRRWPNMGALARQALGKVTLIDVPADSGSLAGDLQGLLVRWPQPLNRGERAAASLVGAARHQDDVRLGLEEALVRPLRRAVGELAAREAARGRVLSPAGVALLQSTLEALWWQRFTSLMARPYSPHQVQQLVDLVLLPIVGQQPAVAAPASAGHLSGR